MCKKICVIGMVLLLAGIASSADQYFVGGGGDSLWTNSGNWNTAVPTASDFAVVNAPAVISSGVNAVCSGGYMATGPGQSVQLDIQSGGSLTTGGIWADAYDATATSVTNIDGSLSVGGEYRLGWAGTATANVSATGSVNAADFLIGTYGPGTLNMNGGSFVSSGGLARIAVGIVAPGTINMTDGTMTGAFMAIDSYVANIPGHVQLDGGVINVGDLVMNDAGGNSGTMDITGGTLKILGWDATLKIDAFAAMGYVTGYGSAANVQAVFDGTDTIVTAIPEPATLLLLSIGLVALRKRK